MSKYTDFFPASSGTGFPFTGSGQMTGSYGTDVLLVEGGVDFLYYSRGTTAGWTILPAAMNNTLWTMASVGDSANDLLVAAGLNPAITNVSEQWNGTTWTSIAPLPANRYNTNGTGTTTAGIVFGGNTTNSTSTTAASVEYNGATWSAGGNLNISRRGSEGAGGQNDALSMGGSGGQSGPIYSSTEEYNGTNWIAPGNNLAIARENANGNGSSTAAFVIGGTSIPGVQTPRGEHEEYNGVSWSSPGQSLNTARQAGVSAGVQSQFIIYGGGNLNNTELWNGVSFSEVQTLNNTANFAGGEGASSNSALNAGGAVTNVTEEYQGQTISAGLYTTFEYSETDGTTTVSDLVETSAERYKENIQTLDNQVDKIKQLRPVQYSWKKDNRKDIGFIAEEVEKVYPQLVEKDEEGNVSGMSYSKLAAAVVKTIQEQQEQIAKLNDELDNIK